MNTPVVIVQRMHEFDSVSVSSFEASSLAAKLTAKSNEGWEVVAIVPAGSEVTAFLRREASAAATSAWSEGSSSDAAPPTVSEPAGWGSAPESSGWGGSSGASSTSSWAGGSQTPAAGTTSWGPSSSSVPSAPSAPVSAPSTPAVPAGWYADPAGRYELRYWDGSAWTEHVSRAGQQYTDPPVA